MNPTVTEVKAEFADERGWPRTTPLPHDRVRRWMRDDDLEVLGATHRLLRHKGGLARVEPPLELAEYQAFMTRYLGRCLCEYTREPWDVGDGWEEADWGLEATHAAVYWFLELWQDKTVPRAMLEQTKAWFAGILMGCPQVSGLLATAIYDHLLSRRSLRRFFADWQADSRLSRFLE